MVEMGRTKEGEGTFCRFYRYHGLRKKNEGEKEASNKEHEARAYNTIDRFVHPLQKKYGSVRNKRHVQ